MEPEVQLFIPEDNHDKKKKAIIGSILAVTALFILVFCVVFVFLIKKNEAETAADIADESSESSEEKTEVETEGTAELPEEVSTVIDFQPIIDEWARGKSGTRSVLIYDLENEQLAGSLNIEQEFNTASLYKLFVVYEGYRRIERGEWEGDEIVVANKTVLECLDLAIRESNSSCAETLWQKIGHAELDEIIENDFLITNSNISSLISTPEDIFKMLKIYYRHEEIKDTNLLARMEDSFLNQPETEYDWRQGLPSGFSEAVNVYNKVGWQYNPDAGYWVLYHDAAIVEFPEENRHFIVVVMTSVVDYEEIRELGTEIENYYYQVLKN